MKNDLKYPVLILLVALVGGCARESTPHPPTARGVSGGTATAQHDAGAYAAALESAQAWLQLVDEGRFDSSWDEAAAHFKNAIRKEKWRETLRAVHTPLGRPLSRILVSRMAVTSLPGAPDGAYVVIQYGTSFEHKKHAVETVTPMREHDGTWHVSGYFIR